MDYARWSTRLEWAVAAAVVGVHLVIFCTAEQPGRPNLLLTSAHDAQLLSGIVLILAWAILGPGRWWLRLAALPVLVVLWFLPWNPRMVRRETSDDFLVLLITGAALAIAAIRVCGLRTWKLGSPDVGERGPQFSLFGLLLMTTLIASTIGALEWLRPALSADRGESLFGRAIMEWEFRRIVTTPEPTIAPQLARQLVVAVSVVVAALSGLWIVLRPGAVWLRLAAVVVAISVLGVYLTHLAGIGGDEFVPSAVNLSISLAQIAGLAGITALPLRLMNYRLQRQSKAVAVAAPQVTERRRVMGRVAALVGLFLLVGVGLPLASVVAKHYGDRFDPPTKAFAEWMEPWRKRSDIHFYYAIRVSTLTSVKYPIQPGGESNSPLLGSDVDIELRTNVARDEAEPRGREVSGGSLGPSSEEGICPNP